MRKTKIFLDGSVLAAELNSGIKHYAAGLYTALDSYLPSNPDTEAYLIIPFKRLDKIRDYDFQNIKIRRIFMPMRVWRALVVREWLPPMDIFFGRGVYVFPDYNTWRLLFSSSVTTIHDLSFEKVPQFVDDKNAAFLRATVKRTLGRSRAILTVTETMRHEIAKFYNVAEERIFRTVNAADKSHFYRRSDSEVASLKRRFEIYGDYIISVGNIEPRKNHINMIRSFARLPKEIRDKYTLVFVGAGGWKLEEIKQEINKSLDKGIKIKIFQGIVEDADMPAFYTGATATLFLSYYEGFGMSIVESMSCGTPVICSNASVMPEVAGEAGIMVEPDNVKQITGSLATLLTTTPSRRKVIIETGLNNTKRFSWGDSLQGLLQAIDYAKGGKS